MAGSVIWFRRDLRLSDHGALLEGCRRGVVLPLFILDPALLFHPETASARVAFLLLSLRALDQDLRCRGGRLLVRYGDPVVELLAVVRAAAADRVIAHTDSERLVGRWRDAAINRRLAAESIPIEWIEPAGASDELISYPAWSRRWHAAMAVAPAAAPARIAVPPPSEHLPDLPIPSLQQLGLPADGKPLPAAGTEAALARLEAFCTGQASRRYYWELSYPAARVSSGLSPYLKFGVISPRQCLQRLVCLAQEERARQRSAVQLISRLRWGAGMHQRFRYLPQLEQSSLWSPFDDGAAPPLADRPTDGFEAELYSAWQQGRTGFPIVDAAARCLAAEGGWLELNFRSRAIYASFLANLGGIDWRWGALHFMRHLLDGDCPIDHYQWAMQAGVTAAGSGSWTRIYHPGQVAVDRCDPQGLFIRRWLPELAGLTNDQLGAPPPMAAYPRPILDYDSARLRRLAILERRRGQITDPCLAMARLPPHLPAMFPAALDLDRLDPPQWQALLSWFQPGRRAAGDGAQPSQRRRGSRRAVTPGQLSLDL
ncbi:MAG: hypothetical protein RLZZ459_1569 [Cyanobacteriota bacterium]